MKLTTLHRTIKPELLDSPNTLLTAEAADIGAADTRYWNVTLESIWHECLKPEDAARLVDEAFRQLDVYGQRGERLKAVARYLVERKN